MISHELVIVVQTMALITEAEKTFKVLFSSQKVNQYIIMSFVLFFLIISTAINFELI